MRSLLFVLLLFRFGAVRCQEPYSHRATYADAASTSLLDARGPIRFLHIASWGNWYHRSYDSIVRTLYPSGNLQTELHYSRPWGYLNMSWTYRDNDRREVLRVDKAGADGKPAPFQTVRYDSTGMAEVTWMENGIPQHRSFRRVLDAQGRVLDEIRLLGSQEEYHYRFVYDAGGRKQEERHLDANGTLTDTYSFRYDLQGRLVQEIQKRPGDKVESMQLHDYDVNGRRNRSSFFAAGYYLDRYTTYAYDSAGRKTEETGYYANGTMSGHNFYRYDAAGDLVESSWVNAPAVDRHLAYGPDGNLLRDIQPGGETRTTYVGGRRMRDSVFSQGRFQQVRTYRYDAAGRLVAQETGAAAITYTYGRCPGPDTVSTTTGGPRYGAVQRTISTYDRACRPLEVRVFPAPRAPDFEGYGFATQKGPLRYRYVYDRSGRPEKETAYDGSDSLLYTIYWSYRRDGAQTVSLLETAFAGAAADVTCMFDKDGLLRTFIRRSGGRVETHSYSYQFDERGNWTRREDQVTGRSGAVEYELALRTIRYE